MRYTYSKDADKIVQRELEVIKKIIIKKVPGLISIVLFGSFGRGEGGFIKENNRVELIGDYDMYIITKKQLSGEILEKVSKECADALGKGDCEIVKNIHEKYNREKFFHIDIRGIAYRNLKKLLPMQRSVDLKNSTVIYGPNVLRNIPDLKLSLSEALRPLFNRANYLLASKGREDEVKTIAAIKAVIDCCSCLLMSERKYASKCKDRNEIFQKMNFPKKFKDLVNKATRLKIYGYSNNNPEKLWKEAKEFLEFSLRYVLKKQGGIELHSWEEIGNYIAYKLPYTYFNPYTQHHLHMNFFPAQYYLGLKFIFACWGENERIIKPFFTWKDPGLKLAASLITFLYEEEEISRKYLKKITTKTNPLRQRILKLYSFYFLQRLR